MISPEKDRGSVTQELDCRRSEGERQVLNAGLASGNREENNKVGITAYTPPDLYAAAPFIISKSNGFV